MAINKTINKSTKSHGAMRNCMEYVLKESKIGSGLVMVTGPFDASVIDYDSVYQSFLTEKRIWNKDSGRMYAHNIISWHEDEEISLEEALDFGLEFALNWFDGFQTLVAVHQDRDHIHVHLVTNTVSYADGRKLHNTRKDLERMKQLTNEMCMERGLSVASKGKNFYGEDLEEGHVRAWSKDKYHLLANESKDSYLMDYGLAVLNSLEQCESKEQFICNMKKRGWKVIWKESRKNITFENEEGKKVRDKNLSKTFNLNITKEGLLNEFERQSKIRNRRESDDELERYCREVEAIIGGDYGVAEAGESKQCESKETKSEVAGVGSEVGGREEETPRRKRYVARR